MLRINEQIPDELEIGSFHNESIKRIKFKDYRGKWIVLVFYPADFTFICPTELEEYAELYNKFKENDCEVMSVSTDSVYVHKAWHDKSEKVNKVKYPMIADPTGKLCRLFGTYIEDVGESLRGTFLIDPDGKLKAYELHDNDIGRSAAEMLRKLQAAKIV